MTDLADPVLESLAAWIAERSDPALPRRRRCAIFALCVERHHYRDPLTEVELRPGLGPRRAAAELLSEARKVDQTWRVARALSVLAYPPGGPDTCPVGMHTLALRPRRAPARPEPGPPETA